MDRPAACGKGADPREAEHRRVHIRQRALRLPRRRRMPTPEVRSMSRAIQVKGVPLPSEQIPQANKIARVIDYVLLANQGATLSFSDEERDRHYHSHAAILLGFLDKHGVPTAAGRALAKIDD